MIAEGSTFKNKKEENKMYEENRLEDDGFEYNLNKINRIKLQKMCPGKKELKL